MPEIRDERRRNDLDLFVLALIEDGVATPYALQKEASLSPGVTIPAIQRLLEAGLVRQGKLVFAARRITKLPQPGGSISLWAGARWSMRDLPEIWMQISV
jgi:hypothetical protein